VEPHLEPLAIAANITQVTHCHLNTVLLTFGTLSYGIGQWLTRTQKTESVTPPSWAASKNVGWQQINWFSLLLSLSTHFFQMAPFAPHPHFINAHIKSLLASLYSWFFQSEAPNTFYTEVHDFLMGSSQYNKLEATCARHMYNVTHVVWYHVPFKINGYWSAQLMSWHFIFSIFSLIVHSSRVIIVMLFLFFRCGLLVPFRTCTNFYFHFRKGTVKY